MPQEAELDPLLLDADAIEIAADMQERFGAEALERARTALHAAEDAHNQSSVSLWMAVCAILQRSLAISRGLP